MDYRISTAVISHSPIQYKYKIGNAQYAPTATILTSDLGAAPLL
jgi:hypothetical protein